MVGPLGQGGNEQFKEFLSEKGLAGVTDGIHPVQLGRDAMGGIRSYI